MRGVVTGSFMRGADGAFMLGAVLRVAELRSLVRRTGASADAPAAASMGLADLLDLLEDRALSSQAPAGSLAPGTSLLGSIEHAWEELAGPCVRLSTAGLAVAERVQLLFFLTPGQGLAQFLLRDLGTLRYPSYRVWRTGPVFTCTAQLHQYEAALALEIELQGHLEANELAAAWATVEPLLQALECGLPVADPTEDAPKPEAEAPPPVPFLGRFRAEWVHARLVTHGVSLLEKRREYRRAVAVLRRLLAAPWCPDKRGNWWSRLSLDLEHLGSKEAALRAAETGLDDPAVRWGDRVGLQRRVVRLAKPPRRWRKPSFAGAVSQQPKQTTIQGRPMNCEVGRKSRFMGHDDETCTVEELALQHYAQEGGWEGIHSEGSIFSTLFTLLMWDVLFQDVPDVFLTPFQTGPMDVGTDMFRAARQEAVELRLSQLREPGMAVELLTRCWETNFGVMCRGMKWEVVPLPELCKIATCIGATGLATICSILVDGHGGGGSGMPDLLLWREEPAPMVKLVEVKGPNDTLAEHQRAWITSLEMAGLDVEVCKVEIPSSQVKKRRKKS
ncbi:hypothetical protein CYMTET_36319 [Cymbomonas tetramitiformis]|uniref:Fanconi-associated nuclease n=1 Tax=Cymbomonas tetramitiformis TaxID=36881 RepID=A0AAE0CHY0_9CHLO|nr:hypothetical protein CYMTET_36319 [Cymbomonas tetramitiformis]